MFKVCKNRPPDGCSAPPTRMVDSEASAPPHNAILALQRLTFSRMLCHA